MVDVSGNSGGSKGQFGNTEPLASFCRVFLTPCAASYESKDVQQELAVLFWIRPKTNKKSSKGRERLWG